MGSKFLLILSKETQQLRCCNEGATISTQRVLDCVFGDRKRFLNKFFLRKNKIKYYKTERIR